jgi:hypothetical protein
MGSIFSPKMPAPPPLPEPIEPPEAELSAEEKEKIRQDQLRRDRKRTGRKSTILTGPMGVEEEAEIGKKTLLGE